MLRALVIAVALVCAAVSLSPAQATKAAGTITVTPGVDSRHFTVEGCGYRADKGPNNYYTLHVETAAQTGIVTDANIGADGCFATVVDMTGYAAGEYNVWLTYRKYSNVVSNVVPVTLD
jgi:hypothetical protein